LENRKTSQGKEREFLQSGKTIEEKFYRLKVKST
jgi:hypothetical protein